ncbi:hypothetical protein ACO0LD_28310 [Undibacterium sp. Ji83W]|uniref:hypothetical protein n=1 Tax=Undibacterium sp. Ji83W TaxID=3413043 RepID=UPI003BF2CF7C
MPNRSSIRGRDGLYYRVPDLDELDGYDNFNPPAYGKDLADELQLSDFDPNIRLLQSDTARSRGNFDTDSDRPQVSDVMGGMSTRFIPAGMDFRYAAENGNFSAAMADTSGYAPENLQTSTPVRGLLSRVMPGNDEDGGEISVTPLARRFENDAYYTSAPDAYGNAITEAEKTKRSTRSAPSDSSGSGWAAPQTSSARLADYAAQTYGRAAGCSTIDECKRFSDQLRTHADTYNSGYSALKDSDQKAAADEYLRMATIATRAADLTESRATYLARPPKSVVPSVFDPDTHQGSSYGSSGYPVLDGFRQYRDGVTGAGVAYISPAAISPWSSPLIQDDPGTKDYLAGVDYRTLRFLFTGGAQLATDGVLGAAFSSLPRTGSYTMRGPRTAGEKYFTTTEKLPHDWVNRLDEIRVLPNQENAESMADSAAKYAAKEPKYKATEGMAGVNIDNEGKVTINYSKKPHKKLNLPPEENPYVRYLIEQNNANPETRGFGGRCAEPKIYANLLNNGVQPGGYMGAAQIHDPLGRIRAACPNCGSLNRYFGVGYRDGELGVVPPRKSQDPLRLIRNVCPNCGSSDGNSGTTDRDQ